MSGQTTAGRGRRSCDVIVAGIVLLMLVPVLVLLAALVLSALGRPVLFRQRRSGRHGVEFTIYKFRTMRVSCDPGEPDRARHTKVGTLLRRTSLDELPQLVNVLRGDMSLIGPRPTLPAQVRAYDSRQRERLAVRPGLTGWAQVRGRNSVTWPDRIELDLWYLENRSWLLDLRIIVLTVPALVRPRGISGPGGENFGFPSASPVAGD